MSQQEIKVWVVGRTVPNRDGINAWIRSMEGCADYTLPEGGSNGAVLTSVAAKACYRSFVPGANPNVTKVRADLAEHLDNVLRQGHGSVLEHVVYNFGVTGLTRVCTAELNRHRAGAAISEQSMRFVRFSEDIPYWMPVCFREDPTDSAELAAKKAASRAVIDAAMESTKKHYAELLSIWDLDGLDFSTKKTFTSAFRRIVPMGVSTAGMWSFNMRALRHILTMRCSKSAEEEIAVLATAVLSLMQELEPELFGDFKLDDGVWKPQHVKV